MALNVMRIKKIAGIFLAGILPVILYSMFLLSGWGLLFSSIAALIGIVLGYFIFSLLYRHPIFQMVEGKGLLVLTIDSTGVIKPFLAKVNPPFVISKKGSTVFDRKSVSYIKPPADAKLEKTEDETIIKLPNTKVHENLFAFSSFPVLIYNQNLETFLSKEALSKMELNSTVTHSVIYLKRKTEELTSIMRDFARYVVEMSKPKPAFAFLSNWWFWILIIGALAIVLMLFLKGGGAGLIGSLTAPIKSAAPSAIVQ